MAKLNAAARRHIKPSNFALPGKREYPIEDMTHAKLALAMVEETHNPAEIKAVDDAVYRKYPSLRPGK